MERPFRNNRLAVVALIVAIGASAARAQSAPPADAIPVDPRMPAQSAIDDFRGDSDFDYGRNYREPESLWDRVARAIMNWLTDVLGEDGVGTFWDVVGYAAIAFAVGLIVLKLAGADVMTLFFKRKKEEALAGEGPEDDVRTIDYATQIERAASAGDYRLAVRLHYLRLLRDLDESGAITWRENKTDSDYARELAATSYREAFERASLLFEYVWYGDFPIDRASYERIAQVIGRVASLGGVHAR